MTNANRNFYRFSSSERVVKLLSVYQSSCVVNRNYISFLRLFSVSLFCYFIEQTRWSLLHSFFQRSEFFLLFLFVFFLDFIFTFVEDFCSIIRFVALTFCEDFYFFDNHIFFWFILWSFFYRCDSIDSFYTADYFPENSVSSIQPRSSHFCDEELRTICVRPRVCHRKVTFSFVSQIIFFIIKFVSWVSHSCSCRVATLDHKVFNHSVEDNSIVVRLSFCFRLVFYSSLC